jgi:hypothetical protein
MTLRRWIERASFARKPWSSRPFAELRAKECAKGTNGSPRRLVQALTPGVSSLREARPIVTSAVSAFAVSTGAATS